MCEIRRYLAKHARTDMPEWLATFKRGNRLDRDAVLNSRVVFYPGCGTDGHPVTLFGGSHSAHVFVYVDYQIPRQEIEETLYHERHGFRGYDVFDTVEFTPEELSGRWKPHAHLAVRPINYGFASVDPFGFMVVLQRKRGYDEDHGPQRLAIIFLGADAFATFDALFCQEGALRVPPPFAILLQDDGFGGNYDRFGGGYFLERLAQECEVFPPWLLIAENTEPWDGYEKLDLQGSKGGANHMRRYLWKRTETTAS